MSQLSFGFEGPEGHVEPDVPRKRPASRRKSAPVQTAAQPAVQVKLHGSAQDTLAKMADTLAAHPDFKVLRRLVPCLHYPAPEPGALTQRVLILDTETTGLDVRAEQIIELAMLAVDVDLRTGLPVGPVEVYEDFEDPGKPIPPTIMQITGIDSAMVQGHRLRDQVVNDMVARADLIVAHNAGFDRPFVEARLPVFVAKSWACSFAGIDWKTLGTGSAKLEFLAHESGWFYDAHRAQVDCHALLRVLSSPLQAEQSEGSSTGLQQLFKAAENARTVVKAFGSPFETKDKLKARGYRWDAEARVWYTAVKSAEALDAEAEWLKAEVYGGRAARIGLETQDALVQFSSRSGKSGDRIL